MDIIYDYFSNITYFCGEATPYWGYITAFLLGIVVADWAVDTGKIDADCKRRGFESFESQREQYNTDANAVALGGFSLLGPFVIWLILALAPICLAAFPFMLLAKKIREFTAKRIIEEHDKPKPREYSPIEVSKQGAITDATHVADGRISLHDSSRVR